MDISYIKRMVDHISPLISAVTQATTDKDAEFADTLTKYDMADYMIYLMAADREIQQHDADLFSEFMGESMSLQSIKNLITNKSTYFSEVGTLIPNSLLIAIRYDNLKWDDGKRDFCYADVLFNLYIDAGSLIIDVYQSAESKGVKALMKYLNMLYNHILKTDKIYQYKFKQGTIDAPIKFGVAAPKKR